MSKYHRIRLKLHTMECVEETSWEYKKDEIIIFGVLVHKNIFNSQYPETPRVNLLSWLSDLEFGSGTVATFSPHVLGGVTCLPETATDQSLQTKAAIWLVEKDYDFFNDRNGNGTNLDEFDGYRKKFAELLHQEILRLGEEDFRLFEAFDNTLPIFQDWFKDNTNDIFHFGFEDEIFANFTTEYKYAVAHPIPGFVPPYQSETTPVETYTVTGHGGTYKLNLSWEFIAASSAPPPISGTV